MARRVVIGVVVVLAVLAWMLTDSQPVPSPLPDTPAAEPVAEAETPPAAPAELETVTLPPPPTVEAPAEPVTPLKAAPAPLPKARTVTPLAAQTPQRETPTPAELTPLTKSAPTETSKVTALAAPEPIAPLQPTPRAQETRPAEKPQPPQPTQPKAIAAARPAPPAPPPAPTPPDAKTAATEGRPLLKLLELGEGPSVEIAWPASAAERRHLYQVFRQCYGMRIAVMDNAGKLYAEDGAPGDAWSVNLDRYSGFVRQSSGGAALEEHDTARRIRVRHGVSTAATVRLFPRRADALLLGGLKHLIGSNYAADARIRARYEVSGWRVGVGGLSVGTTPIAGRVDLSGAAQRHCHLS